MEFIKEREKVAAFMRRLYEQKLTTASGGNVSLKIKDRILITPSQIDKAKVVGEQIIVLNQKGEAISQRHKKSMETGMHVAIYEKRPDINAIVHAHPVFATSFAIAGKQIKTNFAGEARAVLGEPVLAEYALMGTQQLANLVAEAALKSNAVLLQNHGIITMGETLFQAYDRMEVLEASARMTLITEMLGGSKDLTIDQLKEIDNLFI